MRSKKSKIMMGGFVMLFVMGCFGVVQAESPALIDKTYKGTTLRFIAETVPPTEAIVKFLPEFEKSSGIKVETEQYPFDHVMEKTMMDLAAGTRIYDVLSTPYQFLGQFAEMGYIQPIEKYMNDPNLRDPDMDITDYIEGMWKASAEWKEKIYGFPSNSCIMFLWYRRDLLENLAERRAFKEKYGYYYSIPPTNWIEYKDVAEFFTRPERELYGVALAAKRHDALSCEWMNYVWSFGGEVLDKSGNPVINSLENVEALKYFVSLLKYAPPGTTTYTWDEVTTAFQKGRVVMAIQWNDPAIDVEDPTKSEVAGKMGFGPVPVKKQPAAHFGAWTFFIPKLSKHPEAAYLFIQWVTSKEIQIKLAREGMVPCRYSSYADSEVRERASFYPATLAALEMSNYRPRIPEWTEMVSKMQLALSQALAGEKTPREALDWLQDEYLRILGK